jgi:spermidine synthase
LASTAFAFLPAAAFAAISPMCVRLALRDVALAGSVAGRLSALNTFGSIVGTLATSFLLVPHFGTKAIFLILGLTSVVVGAIVGYRPMALGAQVVRKHVASVLFVVLPLVAIAAVSTASVADAATPALGAKESVLESVESEYNNIFVVQNGNMLFMNFGYRGSQYIESVLDRSRPNDLAVEYTRYMSLALIYPDKIERAALVGLGGGRTGSYVVKTVPGLRLDVAELDPEVIRLAQKYFGVEQGDRLKIHPQDGRLYLNKVKDIYDVVMVDAYRGPFVPYHLLTKEFFALIKSRLSPTGVVVQNIEPTTMLLDSAIVTIRSVFPNVDVYNANGNIVVVGYSGPAKSSDVMRAKAKAFDDKYHPVYSMQTLLDAKRGLMVSPDAKLLTDDFAPVEMLHTVKRHNEKLPSP